ncbi:hypothetical protein IEQ11_24320 [Lysobacter capsici]|uniref:hypothetical protein n=1 Tax=Lysobacter capsici TaxID=435897 RepID=UPI0017816AC5|nr:hypothetical protein [Lysobacter capsici]UOF14797.1 hypothetical protein IEQ11_24320 [Lysobacter capsici]
MNRFYDGIDYRCSSSDAEQAKAIEIVINVLGFHPGWEALQYSLALYAGGTGIDDKLAIRFKLEASNRPILWQTLRLKSPTEAMASPDWSESFEWLVRGDAASDDITSAVRAFIDRRRHPFQDPSGSSTTIAFSEDSDVNSWCVVWTVGDWANYLASDQG